MLALLSIRPIHAENIFSGFKTFEYRRKVFARQDIRTVLVYSTKPVGKLIGEFDIERILEDRPTDLWKHTRKGSGISEQYFYDYFAGCKLGYALKIARVRRFKVSVDPRDVIADFTAPQSFRYVQEHVARLGAAYGASHCRT